MKLFVKAVGRSTTLLFSLEVPSWVFEYASSVSANGISLTYGCLWRRDFRLNKGYVWVTKKKNILRRHVMPRLTSRLTLYIKFYCFYLIQVLGLRISPWNVETHKLSIDSFRCLTSNIKNSYHYATSILYSYVYILT